MPFVGTGPTIAPPFPLPLLSAAVSSLKLQYAKLPFSQTGIQPILIGDNATTMAFAENLRERHMFVPAIRPPTVPRGTARLRVSITANHTADDLFDLITALTDLDVELIGQRK